MRFLYGSLVLSAVALLASAATQSPDREAYQQAVRRNDARERVNALRKFLKDYPKSSRVDRANELLLKTLVENWPDQSQEIRDQIAVMTRNIPADDKSDKLDTIADILVTHAVLLDRAQDLERQALNAFHPKRYLAKLKNRPIPAKYAAVVSTPLEVDVQPGEELKLELKRD